ncbi:MAG: hypothetical protein EB078_03205 [Proteobacteria bacterium]|nr:hypothetical protein [Pseudomonadota bacterium]NDG19276.1 hypothetical protein [Betaproteobacteria bacterium]
MNRYIEHAAEWVWHEMSMDVRHAVMIREFLLAVEPPASVVEVGCCYGASTAQVLYACEQAGWPVVLIDPLVKPSVLAMVRAAAGLVEVVVDESRSIDSLGDYLRYGSIVILDGDHRREYMELESAILAAVQPRAVILHDVTSDRDDCDGPAWFLHEWQRKGYSVSIDYLKRPRENTHRGLAIMCRWASDHVWARRAICAEP